jgi:hypothetical protein
MNRLSGSIVLAEQQVAEARMVAFAEFQAAQAQLRRRMGSPIFIGGVLLGAVLLGLALGRGKRHADTGSPGAWSHAAKAAQALLPFLLALNSAAARPRANINGTPR